MPVIDFSEVKSLKPIPDGWYDGVVHACAEAVANASGNPIVRFQYKVEGGEFDGRFLFDHINLTGDPESYPMQRTKEVLAALGVPVDEDGPQAFECDDLVGAKVKLRVKVVADQDGEPSNKVARVKPSNGSMADALR